MSENNDLKKIINVIVKYWVPAIVTSALTFMITLIVVFPVVIGMQYDASVNIEISYLSGRDYEIVESRYSKAFEGSLVPFRLREGWGLVNYSFWVIECDPLCTGQEKFLMNITYEPEQFCIPDEYNFLIRVERNKQVIISRDGLGIAAIEFK